MKVFIYIFVLFLQQLHADADCSWFSGLSLGPACITLTQLYNATATLCSQKNNTALWQKVIDCHKPISEDFMRYSGEGRCFYPNYGVDPTNYTYTIQDVFFNICGLVESPTSDLIGYGVCLVAGWYTPWIDSHSTEVSNVKANWGKDVPCSIGECVLNLGLGVGA